jgi:hypothetical protein
LRPNIFTFNFNGFSGSFFTGNDNQIKLTNNSTSGFKVDITNLVNQPITNSCKPLASEIKITDDNGNIYYFGGQTKNLEYTISLNHDINQSLDEPSGVPIITAWFLRQIQYTNGEIINFNYKDDAAPIIKDSFCYSQIYQHVPHAESKKFIIYNES